MKNDEQEQVDERQKNWPPGVTRIPYWVFQRDDVYQREQERLFRGNCWNYLCLEADLVEPGDFRTGHVGDTHVIITRDMDGDIYGFENRCAHRGALLTYKDSGKAKNFSCVYHGWGHSLQGDLDSVTFKEGLNGCGGMPPTFCMHKHGPRKMRIAVVHGLVFGSFSNDVPDIEDYLGDKILERIARVLAGRKLVVIGRFTQIIPNNWKLYAENTKDSYHASILHLFFTTFEINRLTQKGGLIVDDSGANHVSYSIAEKESKKETSYSDQEIRSQSDFKLKDASILDSFDEIDDDITLQILSVFPGFVLQQIFNSLVVRQILPRGTDKTELNWTYLGFEDDTPEQRKTRIKQCNLIGPAGFVSMEDGCVGGFVQRGIKGASQKFAVLEMGGESIKSSESRATEAAVRGFWTAYRKTTEL